MVLISQREAAKIVGVSQATLSRWKTSGIGPNYYVLENGSLRYDTYEVEKWLSDRHVKLNGEEKHV